MSAVPADVVELYPEHLARLERGYADALSAAPADAVVVHSGRSAPKSRVDDQYWPLRPTPHFQHWLALAEQDCAVLIRPGQRPTLFRPVASSFWEGSPEADIGHALAGFDVVEVGSADAIAELLPARATLAFIGDDRERAASWGIAEHQINPAGLCAALDQLRALKSAYEIACTREANRCAARGHRTVREAFLSGARSELELHLAYLAATEQDDVDTPYKNIVALGEHAGVLHHVHYGRDRIARDTSLLVDAGATCLGYHADITRTEVRGSGSDTELFRGLVQEIDGLQRELCARIAADTPFEAIHDHAHELLAGVLSRVGLAKASPDELVATGVTRAFFPHGLGHSLGLQTHDVGCRLEPPAERNPFLRNTTAIANGQVFTIEPGCYFIPSLLEPLRSGASAGAVDWVLADRLASFGGIRIEDNIAVVDGAADNLTREYLPA